MNTRTELANRHIAKLLDNLDKLVDDMPTLAKTAVKQEMHWLAEDIENNKQVSKAKQGDSEDAIR
jgi:hypothetical protein